MATDAALARQRRLIEALRDPARYPHPVDNVTVIETHISFVLLTGVFAYKIKKAIDLDFVDYTQLERRRFFCDEELRLNRRLAPQLYLAVLPLAGTPDNPSWENNEPIEYAVQMAEFPQRDLLDQALNRGELTPLHIDALADMLANFHSGAPPCAQEQPYGSPESVWRPVADNFNLLQSLPLIPHPQLGKLQTWCDAEYQKLEAVFRERKAAGWIRECHGDLHLGNLLLFNNTPLVFDCIEFSPALRWIDIINDLAFLIMDLSAHGRPDYAWRLLNGWLEKTGDYAGLALLRFYLSYRALVRAKVAGLRSCDPDLPLNEQQTARNWAATYLDHACRVASPAPRALLLMHGFSGSGKSRLAQLLAEHLGGICLRSDVERKRLHHLAPLAASQSAIHADLYAETVTRATYEHLAALASSVLASDYPVIIDATCLQKWQRAGLRELAQQQGIPWRILDCHAPLETLRQRVASRKSDASEATLEALERQIQEAEPLDAQERQHTISVDTTTEGRRKVIAEIQRHLR